ncbi:hypothetical protein [Pseudoramibacter faecis]|uniref:hypothetical protein n=1 Tax=Pseudoramibacter faecis TaxID=3108534 RepID=UPI002E77BFB5|nr:hypothetical protein [Pseudoramibacter sp. HA2172]
MSALKNKNRIDNQQKHDKIKVQYYVNYHSIVESLQISNYDAKHVEMEKGGMCA